MITTCWNRVRLNGKTSGLRARRSFECAAHAPNKPTPIFVHVSLPLPLGPRLCLQPPTLQMTQFGMPDLIRQVFLECALTLVHMIWFWVWYWFYLIPLLGWCIMLSGVRDILYMYVLIPVVLPFQFPKTEWETEILSEYVEIFPRKSSQKDIAPHRHSLL